MGVSGPAMGGRPIQGGVPGEAAATLDSEPAYAGWKIMISFIFINCPYV